jgi:CIC family chloride channel protein
MRRRERTAPEPARCAASLRCVPEARAAQPAEAPARRRRRARLQQGQLFLVAVAIACGIGGAFAAIAFRILIRLATAIFFGDRQDLDALLAGDWLADPQDPLALARALPWWVVLAIPALGGLVVGPLVTLFPREAKGHGVPEVMEAVALRGGLMRGRTVVLRTLASALSIGSGGSVGREGPIVQIGAALGSFIGQVLSVPPRLLRTIVGCGAAAGIAATFNAPIAGALFAVEVIIGDFAVAQFSPIVIASVVATVLSRWLLGDHPSFQVPDYVLVAPFELVPYALLGVAAGLVGIAFMSSLYRAEDAFERLRVPAWLKPAIGGLLVGAIGIALPQVLGVGYGTITPALQGTLAPSLLAALLVAKLVATSLTVGSGGSGGVFSASLFLGAMTGGVLGDAVHALFPESSGGAGAYALVGMGALVAATTHAPITAIVMIFEMTQSISIIPPLMAACVISTLVATRLSRESIYTMKLARRGVELRPQQDASVLRRLCVRDVMARDAASVPASARFDELLELVVRSSHVEFYVLDERGELVGSISLAALRQLLLDQDALRHVLVAGDLAVPHPPTVTEDDDLDTAMQILGHADLDEIAVVERANPRKLVGTLTLQRVIDVYNQEVLHRDLAGGVSSSVGLSARMRQVPLGGGYVVQEIDAPLSFLGHSLRELAVRERHGVQVVLIRSPSDGNAGRRVRVPGSLDRVQEGDRLVVAGPKEAVEALAQL